MSPLYSGVLSNIFTDFIVLFSFAYILISKIGVYMYTYIYIYIYIYIRSAFNKFPDFFAQAFKIVILLKIQYVIAIHLMRWLTNFYDFRFKWTPTAGIGIHLTDCHSWRVLKMQSDTLEGRYAIKLCFKLGKNATETYKMLQTVSGASCMNRASVFEWHKRFKEVKESVMDHERWGRSKEINTPEFIS